jgi:putative oxidoreductase
MKGRLLFRPGRGFAVLLGWKVRWIALALAIFPVTDAFASHAFWHAVPPDQHNHLVPFLKNAARAGAFLLQGELRSSSS